MCRSIFQGRDLSIAYVLVTLTYAVIGSVFYISFPLAKSCIEDVSIFLFYLLLSNFPKYKLEFYKTIQSNEFRFVL